MVVQPKPLVAAAHEVAFLSLRVGTPHHREQEHLLRHQIAPVQRAVLVGP